MNTEKWAEYGLAVHEFNSAHLATKKAKWDHVDCKNLPESVRMKKRSVWLQLAKRSNELERIAKQKLELAKGPNPDDVIVTEDGNYDLVENTK